jgi:glutathione synthase/RimK-type ligase-like ATP-grasp enzyme
LEKVDAAVRKYCYDELDAFYNNLWLTLLPQKWMSHPQHVYRAENKLLQLNIAQQLGLRIPDTLVTGNPKAIRRFYSENNSNVIIKPISESRFLNEDSNQQLIFTNKLKESDLNVLEERVPLPSIFQENIEKEVELRITIVGTDCFSASINSQVDPETKIDWRKKKLKFESTEIPNGIAAKCVSLVKALKLSFGAIDMIKTPSGEYVFLEINPNGQWVWIEQDTGLPISDSLIKFLQ